MKAWNCNERIPPFLLENSKIIAQFTLTLLFIALGIWFIEYVRAELSEVKKVLSDASWQWVLAGIGITFIYIVLQAQMYVYSFASIRCSVALFDAANRFIKRNLISVFLPAGGVSSLVFFTGAIELTGEK